MFLKLVYLAEFRVSSKLDSPSTKFFKHTYIYQTLDLCNKMLSLYLRSYTVSNNEMSEKELLSDLGKIC